MDPPLIKGPRVGTRDRSHGMIVMNKNHAFCSTGNYVIPLSTAGDSGLLPTCGERRRWTAASQGTKLRPHGNTNTSWIRRSPWWAVPPLQKTLAEQLGLKIIVAPCSTPMRCVLHRWMACTLG